MLFPSWSYPPLHGKTTPRRLGEYTLHHLYVRPLENASPVWHGDLSKQQSLALERVQASVARRILKAPWTTPNNVLFEQLQWPSLSCRRFIEATYLLHQLLQNPTDPLKDCLFPFSSTLSSYNFRKPRQLILPTTRTSWYLKIHSSITLLFYFILFIFCFYFYFYYIIFLRKIIVQYFYFFYPCLISPFFRKGQPPPLPQCQMTVHRTVLHSGPSRPLS